MATIYLNFRALDSFGTGREASGKTADQTSTAEIFATLSVEETKAGLLVILALRFR
jgi:hypothetical protein